MGLILLVISVSLVGLGIVFGATYYLNKIVDRSGR